jgi:hypothetical protein
MLESQKRSLEAIDEELLRAAESGGLTLETLSPKARLALQHAGLPLQPGLGRIIGSRVYQGLGQALGYDPNKPDESGFIQSIGKALYTKGRGLSEGQFLESQLTRARRRLGGHGIFPMKEQKP